MRKIISIMLALVMTLSLCVTTTWAAEPTPTYVWYGNGTAETFTLSTMSDYLGFVKLTQGAVTGVTDAAVNFNGKTVNLGCDIDFSGMDYLHRNAAGTVVTDLRIVDFRGTFDGQEHTLRNLTYKDEYTSNNTCGGMGVFKTVYGTVKNLKVDGVTVTSATKIAFGGIAYICAEKVDQSKAADVTGLYNCHVSNVQITINATNTALVNSPIGGLAGQVNDNNEVVGCTVTNFNVTANNTAYYLGGLIGCFIISNIDSEGNGSGKLDDCHVRGFTANAAALAGHNSGGGSGNFGGIGGLLGYGHSGEDRLLLPITDCTVTGANITVGKMYADSFVGGFLGMSRRRYAASDCSAQGTITVNGTDDSGKCYVGGFCGAPTGVDTSPMGNWPTNEPAVTFKNCTANVNISAPGCTTGGFAGLVGGSFRDTGEYSTKNTAKFENCTATGTINSTTGTAGTSGNTGAFAGNDMNRGTYDDCAASGATNDGDLGFFGGTAPTGAPEVVKLTLNLNGGTGTTFVMVAKGTSIELADYTPTREGYTFVGWADTNDDGTTMILQANTELNFAETVTEKTLSAVWEEIPEVPHQHTRRQPTTTTTDTTTDTTKTDVVTSAKTFDAGIAVYGVMSVLSLTGSAWVVGKKRG